MANRPTRFSTRRHPSTNSNDPASLSVPLGRGGSKPLTGKSILIVEEHTNGHFLAYVSLLAKAATNGGDTVILALPKSAPETGEYKHFILPLLHSVDILFIEQRINPSYLARLSQAVNADVTVVPNGDRFIMRLALHQSWSAGGTLSALVMADPRLDVSGALIHRLKMWIKLKLLKRAERMRNVQISWLRAPGYDCTTAERAAVDPVIIDGLENETALSKQLSELGKTRYWFGLVGVISPWKNLPLILDALAQTNPNQTALLIAGEMSPAVRETVDERLAELVSRGFTIAVIDRLLSNREMNQAVNFVDAILLAYSTNAPPSTLGKAAVLGTQIVAAGSQSFINHVDELHTGGLTSALNAKELRDNMVTAMTMPPPKPHAGLGFSQFTQSLLSVDGLN